MYVIFFSIYILYLYSDIYIYIIYNIEKKHPPPYRYATLRYRFATASQTTRLQDYEWLPPSIVRSP